MSESIQSDLTGATATPAAHLLPAPSDNEQEYECEECRFRVTRSPTQPIEYGHKTTCTHWIGRSAYRDAPAAGGES